MGREGRLSQQIKESVDRNPQSRYLPSDAALWLSSGAATNHKQAIPALLIDESTKPQEVARCAISGLR
jgi:hypothetical protein